MSKLLSKRTAAAAAAALAVIAGGGAALAASGNGAPSPATFLDSVAKHLGISTEKLKDATKAAAVEQVDAALEQGLITKAQADELKSRIESGEAPAFGFGPLGGFGVHGGMHPFGEKLSAAADYLGLTVPQLREKLSAGQSLADVAKAQGKSADGLKTAILDAARTHLHQAVKDGRLTRAQADAMLARLQSEIDDIVNGTLRDPHRGPGEPGGQFFGGVPPSAPAVWGSPA